LGDFLGFKITFGDIRIWELIILFYLFYNFILVATEGKTLKIGLKEPILYIIPFYLITFFSLINIKYLSFFIPGFIIFTLFVILYLIISNQNYLNLSKVSDHIIFMGIIASLWGFIEVIFGFGTGSKWYGVISRADSFFGEPNEFSQYLVLPFGYLISKIFISSSLKNAKGLYKYWIFLLIIIMAQLLSFSRGGILAFLFQMLFLFYLSSRVGLFSALIPKIMLSTILLFIFIILTMNVEIVPNFTITDGLELILFRVTNTLSSSDASLNERFLAYKLGLSDITSSLNYFLLGSGRGSLAYKMGEINYRFEGVGTTSNYIIDIISETGFLGFLSFLFLIFKVFIRGVINFKEIFFHNSVNYNIIYLGSIISMFGLLIGGITSATHLHVFFWFILGIIYSLNNQDKLSFKRNNIN